MVLMRQTRRRVRMRHIPATATPVKTLSRSELNLLLQELKRLICGDIRLCVACLLSTLPFLNRIVTIKHWGKGVPPTDDILIHVLQSCKRRRHIVHVVDGICPCA